MKKILIFLVGLFLWLPVAAWSETPKNVYGVWNGIVTEVVIPGQEYSRYEVTVIMAPSRYRVDYDSLGCGGNLRLMVKQGRFYRFRDELNYGLEACSNGGRTELHFLAPGHASFQWFDVYGVLKAEGRLKRTRQLMAYIKPVGHLIEGFVVINDTKTS